MNLLIKNGRVLDPSQNLDHVADVLIEDGRIAAIETSIENSDAEIVDARGLVVAPARIANTPRPVIVSQEGVEACRLQSDKGIAITLLNWTDEPISTLTVKVPKNTKFKKVTSLQSGAVKSAMEGDMLKITLPLKHVDVLMIE